MDWKKFDWKEYSKNSKLSLKTLADRWKSEDPPVAVMSEELKGNLLKNVEKVGKTKMVSNHSRPWIDPAVAELLKELQEARKCAQKPQCPRNSDRYKVLL